MARALVTGPRVMFADEPTGALDSLNGERVMQLLTDAARDAGAAVVLVTHEPRVAAYSDREIVVRDGGSRDMERAVSRPVTGAASSARGWRLAGGRAGWLRAALTAVGVGSAWRCCCVAAAIPTSMHAPRRARRAPRDDLRHADGRADRRHPARRPSHRHEYRGDVVRGRLLRARGPDAPVPPGLTALPRPGEMAVSPALERLLTRTGGSCCAQRLPGRVTGTIGDAGLLGPAELAFYPGARPA